MAARYNVRNPPNVDDIYPEIAEKYARYIEKRFPGVADEISKETVQHICIFLHRRYPFLLMDVIKSEIVNFTPEELRYLNINIPHLMRLTESRHFHEQFNVIHPSNDKIVRRVLRITAKINDPSNPSFPKAFINTFIPMPTVKKLRNYKGAISLESLDPSAYKLGVEQYRSNNVANPSVKRTANGNANRNRNNRNGNNGNRNNGNRNKTAKRAKPAN
jgi:hypothetical protein